MFHQTAVSSRACFEFDIEAVAFWIVLEFQGRSLVTLWMKNARCTVVPPERIAKRRMRGKSSPRRISLPRKRIWPADCCPQNIGAAISTGHCLSSLIRELICSRDSPRTRFLLSMFRRSLNRDLRSRKRNVPGSKTSIVREPGRDQTARYKKILSDVGAIDDVRVFLFLHAITRRPRTLFATRMLLMIPLIETGRNAGSMGIMASLPVCRFPTPPLVAHELVHKRCEPDPFSPRFFAASTLTSSVF